MNILYIMGHKYTINAYFRECLCNGIKAFNLKRKRLIYIEKILSSFTRLVALFLDSRIHYSLHLYIFHLLFMNFMCRE